MTSVRGEPGSIIGSYPINHSSTQIPTYARTYTALCLIAVYACATYRDIMNTSYQWVMYFVTTCKVGGVTLREL